MKRHRRLKAWGYIVEFIAVGVIYGPILFFAGEKHLDSLLQKNWAACSGIAATLFAAALAGLIYMAQAFASEFGKYLKWLGEADESYIKAYQIQTLLFLMAGIVPPIAAFLKNDIVVHIAWITVLYAVINGMSLIDNTVWLIRMNLKFRVEYDAAMLQEDEKKKG